MPSILDTLLLLNDRNLPPLPAPAPSMPFPVLTPQAGLPMPPGPAPEVAPVAPLPALDTGLISRYAGPEPVAPVVQPPSFIDKLSTALLGVSAGLQGQGPQFVESVRERRERPMREYQAQRERFEARKLRGVEAAEDKQQRQQELTQRRAGQMADREFNVWLKKTGVQDQMAIEQMRHAFDIEKLRTAERIADEKQAAQEAKQLKLKAADLASKYRLAGAKEFSNELAERDLGLRGKVSPAADKWLSSHVQLEQARANKIASGGGGSGGASSKAVKAIEEFEAIKQKLIEAAATGSAQAQKQLMTDLNRAFRGLARFPEIESGFDSTGKWPWAKLRTPTGSVGMVQQPATQAATPQTQNNDPLGIR